MDFMVMEFAAAVFVDRNNGWQIWNETLQSLSMARVKVLKASPWGPEFHRPGARFTKSLNGLQEQLHVLYLWRWKVLAGGGLSLKISRRFFLQKEIQNKAGGTQQWDWS